MNPSTQPAPICVDLDGTLIHSDLLLESFLLLLKANPLLLFLVPFWLLKGKAYLKANIAKRVNLNPAALPYNTEFISWLEQQKSAGRALWLCTASNYRLANKVAEHLRLFEGVLASTDETNLAGSAKARLLVEKFGEKCFDYCGNHFADLPNWRVSRQAIVVNAGKKLLKEAERCADVAAIFPQANGASRAILKALRPHQWVKNILVFVPLAAAHKLGDMSAFYGVLQAFLAFNLCASSVYLLNDMLDLEADRLHPRKCKRPFASGNLSILTGFVLIPLLLAMAVLLACSLPVKFWMVLFGYYVLTNAYSFGLKSIVLVDTITLAGLYTARIIAGAVAINVPLSFWLLLFSVFLFLSLALVKRYAELEAMRRLGKIKAAGRGYHVDDLPILYSMGTASGYLCVLVLALYINSPTVETLYRQPQIIWLLCVLLLYWISRVWVIAHRGEMHDDPVMFAIKDKTSLLIGVLAISIVALAV